MSDEALGRIVGADPVPPAVLPPYRLDHLGRCVSCADRVSRAWEHRRWAAAFLVRADRAEGRNAPRSAELLRSKSAQKLASAEGLDAATAACTHPAPL